MDPYPESLPDDDDDDDVAFITPPHAPGGGGGGTEGPAVSTQCLLNNFSGKPLSAQREPEFLKSMLQECHKGELELNMNNVLLKLLNLV